MNKKKFDRLYQSILNGNCNNINFNDICDFVVDLGFSLMRQSGTSHKIYTIDGYEKPINLQEGKDGCAKAYQVKQIRAAIKTLKIGGKEDA